MRFFLIFCIFFIFSPTIVFAQVFTPQTNTFSSELDGMWEFPVIEDKYKVGEILITDYSKDVSFNISSTGSIEKNRDEHVFNTLNSFLVNNELKIELIPTSEVLFSLSFLCETSETDMGFDDPFLVIFLDDELLFKENNFNLCGSWQEKYFLFPKTDKKHLVHIYAGENGDLENNTLVKIKNINFSKKNNLEPTSTLKVSTSPPKKIVKKEVVSRYPSPPKIYNFNKKPEIKGEVLGDSDKKTESDWKNFIPEYFPLMIGTIVFIFSFFIFIALSDWLIKLKVERKK
jgi:hypothetical protein